MFSAISPPPASAGCVSSRSRTWPSTARAPLVRQGDHVAAGGDPVGHLVPGQPVHPVHAAPLHRAERRPDVREMPAGPWGAAAADDGGQVGDPLLVLDPAVPQQRQPPAGRQHPGHLGHRALRVDPVPGLGHDHQVHAAVGQRDLLARAGQDRDPRHRAAQLLPHAGRRFHGDHVQAALAQLAGQLPGRPRRCRRPAVRAPGPASRSPPPGRAAGPARRRRPPRRRNSLACRCNSSSAIPPVCQPGRRGPVRPPLAGRYARAVGGEAARRWELEVTTWTWRTTGVSCCVPRRRTMRRWRSPTSGASFRPGSTTA